MALPDAKRQADGSGDGEPASGDEQDHDRTQGHRQGVRNSRSGSRPCSTWPSRARVGRDTEDKAATAFRTENGMLDSNDQIAPVTAVICSSRTGDEGHRFADTTHRCPDSASRHGEVMEGCCFASVSDGRWLCNKLFPSVSAYREYCRSVRCGNIHQNLVVPTGANLAEDEVSDQGQNRPEAESLESIRATPDDLPDNPSTTGRDLARHKSRDEVCLRQWDHPVVPKVCRSVARSVTRCFKRCQARENCFNAPWLSMKHRIQSDDAGRHSHSGRR